MGNTYNIFPNIYCEFEIIFKIFKKIENKNYINKRK